MEISALLICAAASLVSSRKDGSKWLNWNTRIPSVWRKLVFCPLRGDLCNTGSKCLLSIHPYCHRHSARSIARRTHAYPLGSIKFCFFQQHRIVYKISFFGNRAFEQCIQVWMAVYRYDRLTFGILISTVGFNEHHLPEKEDILFHQEILIDIEMAVMIKVGCFTKISVSLCRSGCLCLSSCKICFCLIEYSVPAKIVIESKIIIEGIEEIVHIFFGFFQT